MIGKEIGNYKVLKELGKGGMGVVYKTHQLSLGRSVAMKVLPRHLTNDSSFIKRFQNEARAIAKLNHPNIVQIYDIGQQDDIHFYTMEFIEGPALDEVIYKEGFLSPERTLTILDQVSQALHYAHTQGIVHRDIKPSNIMITRSGTVKVTDFGLALQQRTTRLTVDGGIVGTPEYMSPEQAAGQTATAKSDIYSLGVVAYELLTSRVPFEGDSPLVVLNKIQNSEPQWPRLINSNIPVDLENVIRKMMARNPADRYASCQEIIQDIQRVKAQQPVSLESERSPMRRTLRVGVVSLALAAILALGAMLALRMTGRSESLIEPEDPEIAYSELDQPELFTDSEVETTPDEEQFQFPLLKLGNPSEMRQSLLVLENRLKELKSEHRQTGELPPERDLDAIKEQVARIKNRMEDLQDAIYPDELVLKKGNTIRGKIAGESLQKIRFEMPLGPQAIPRERIELTAYATDEESLLAGELLQVKKRFEKFKREASGFQRALEQSRRESLIETVEPTPMESDVPSEIDSEQVSDGIAQEPEEDIENRAEQIPEEKTVKELDL